MTRDACMTELTTYGQITRVGVQMNWCLIYWITNYANLPLASLHTLEFSSHISQCSNVQHWVVRSIMVTFSQAMLTGEIQAEPLLPNNLSARPTEPTSICDFTASCYPFFGQRRINTSSKCHSTASYYSWSASPMSWLSFELRAEGLNNHIISYNIGQINTYIVYRGPV